MMLRDCFCYCFGDHSGLERAAGREPEHLPIELAPPSTVTYIVGDHTQCCLGPTPDGAQRTMRCWESKCKACSVSYSHLRHDPTFYSLFWGVTGIEARASELLQGKHSTTELHPLSLYLVNLWILIHWPGVQREGRRYGVAWALWCQIPPGLL